MIMGTILVSPLISDLAAIFDVSSARAGLLIVAYTAAAAVALPVTGVISDSVGRKEMIVTGLVLFGISGAAVGTTTDFSVALGLRCVQGLGMAAALPNIVAAFGDLYEGPEEATVQGIRIGANSISNVSVPVLAGLLFVTSWRYPFAFYLLTLPIAAWVWATVPRFDSHDRGNVFAYVRDLTAVLHHWQIPMLLGTFFVRFALFYGMLTYVSVLAMAEANLSVAVVGAIVSVRGISLFVSSTQVGRFSTRFDPTLTASAGFALSGLGVLLMGLISTPIVLVIGLLLQGAGDGLNVPNMISMVNTVVPSEFRGSTMSIAYVCQTVGMVVGPATVGLALETAEIRHVFVILGLVGGFAGVLLLAGVRLLQTKEVDVATSRV